MEQEIWKDVKGYEGLYEVSSIGRVRSLPRMAYCGKGWRRAKGNILKYGLRGGYLSVVLCNGESQKRVSVHVILAIAFLNHTPCGHRLVIDHINGIKTDNNLNNIRVVTGRFNLSFGERKDKNIVTSKYAGVYLPKGQKKWVARIVIDKVSHCLGRFLNEIDAAIAYQNEFNKQSTFNEIIK